MGWALNAVKCISFLWAAAVIGKFTPFVFSLPIIFCQWMHLKAVGITSSFMVAALCGIYGATILQMHKNALAFALRRMRFCATHLSECILVSSTNKNTKCFLPWNYITTHCTAHPYLQAWCISDGVNGIHSIFKRVVSSACRHQTKGISLEKWQEI